MRASSTVYWAPVRAAGVQADQLALEIAEQAVEADLATLSVATEQLLEPGVCVAVDDFGTGYSSLRYLQHLPLDVMKIDRTFVANIANATASRNLVSGLVAMGSSLDLQLVAEGIETLDQLRTLQGSNCELGQGYLFSQPSAIGDIDTPSRGPEAAPTRVR